VPAWWRVLRLRCASLRMTDLGWVGVCKGSGNYKCGSPLLLVVAVRGTLIPSMRKERVWMGLPAR
jgi:hypothetical protein